MRIAVPKEIAQGENRIALIPDTVTKLVDAGFEVRVEAGAGREASFLDSVYEEARATIVSDARALYGEADAVLKVRAPEVNEGLGAHEVDMMREGAVLIGFLEPLTNPELAAKMAERKLTSFSMEAVPRISRAQKMDALSSQSNIAGYKAALVAADTLAKFFPMLMTAAGTLAPARTLILGAGVAGLQAIATCRRLGAVVEAFDIRPAVKEEVESLGARFIDVGLEEEAQDEGGYAKEISGSSQQRNRDVIHERAKDADVIITTAMIPGKPAPLLITEDAVKDMKPGSVIVDLAAETGGNCQVTQPGRTVVVHDVTIHAPVNLPSDMAVHASQMYSRNISSLFTLVVGAESGDGEEKTLPSFDFDDEITAGSCITHDGRIVNERVKALLS